MKTKLLALAILASTAAPLLAQEHRITTVIVCYKNRTINIPSYLLPRWIARGATPGPCQQR